MRRALLLLLLTAFAAIAPARAATPISVVAQDKPMPLCFAVPGIADCVDPLFRHYWETNGGLAVFGYPLGRALPEARNGLVITVQAFERNRLEWHSDTPAPYTTQLGRLGEQRLVQLGRRWQDEPSGVVTLGCRYFGETFHTLCEPFLSYWRTHGLELGDPGVSEREALALWGLPLTQPSVERNAQGDAVTTQWFERARLEDHGERGILGGLLGAEVAVPSKQSAPAGWVKIEGDHLVVAGQQVTLKGVNYYPNTRPWSFMWLYWNGPLVQADMRRLRDEVGANVIRVLVPYGRGHAWQDDQGNIMPDMLNRLHQVVQLAGENDLKVIITLFDWHHFLNPKERPRELQYLTAIVSRFRNDDRVLAWDIHNEPDNYSDWQVDPAGVVSWVTATADELRRLDPRHPITVGVGRAATLWQPGRDGRTLLDVSDLVSVHGYDAAQYETMLREVRARTSKPILLEEFGWPSGPACVKAFHDEAAQLFLFRRAAAAVHSVPGVVGGLSWWLQDTPIAYFSPVEDENAYFGLYRTDGSPKPALAIMRDWAVPALPSLAQSSLALTNAPPPAPPALHAPIFFGDLLLINSFKHFWRFFGGETTFGKPITQPYRDQEGRLVQWFERARFELNESTHVQPIDPEWPEGQTEAVYLDRVHLTPLGTQFTANRAFPPVRNPNRADVLFFPETGHTLAGAFRTRWETHSAAFWGPPISEPLTETIDGTPRTVQYFTHWRMELQPDGSIRFGTLGPPLLAQRPCVRGW